ncbi:ArfGap-domain-containing protein [Gonapodya prolifera JEL478]|uniref:ArfGap-domain-containing protein n=1 Tax=Gonapodya prolifera (strain JEL478) TaxID=1344416 RepID=A0A139AYQ7_GONPJ|nr:ArfGap-domain-containing protein [Gonapodya prolifera JEL478]|eukprot:KXS21847.1 ArfGap-domain-containing protein [Gonapodya prolifera JEL478]
MSTRHERQANKSQNEQNLKVLSELLKRPDNKLCADCKSKDPRWASWNLGIFVCMRCAGIHRSLGVHISKMKSVDLDTWTQDQVVNMERWGNARANLYWEASMTGSHEPTGNLEFWIRQKYETKKWARPGGIPDPATLGAPGATAAPQPTPQPQQAPKVQQVVAPPVVPQRDTNPFPSTTFPAPSVVPSSIAPLPAPAPSAKAELFAAFAPAPTPTAQAAPQTAQPMQPAVPDFKSGIMSLYGPPAGAQPQAPQVQGWASFASAPAPAPMATQPVVGMPGMGTPAFGAFAQPASQSSFPAFGAPAPAPAPGAAPSLFPTVPTLPAAQQQQQQQQHRGSFGQFAAAPAMPFQQAPVSPGGFGAFGAAPLTPSPAQVSPPGQPAVGGGWAAFGQQAGQPGAPGGGIPAMMWN